MPVVDVGKVRMLVRDGRMRVPVRVRRLAVPVQVMRMLMLVMRVVAVAMRVGQRLMRMQVIVLLGQVQPHSQRHEAASQPERRCGRFAQQAKCKRGTNERRG